MWNVKVYSKNPATTLAKFYSESSFDTEQLCNNYVDKCKNEMKIVRKAYCCSIIKRRIN